MKKTLITIVSSLIFGAISIIIVFFDKNFEFRWISFSLYLLSIFTIPLYIAIQNRTKIVVALAKIFSSYSFWIILALAILTRLISLQSYPFVSLGDEIRDGGINAKQIVTGEIKNIYGYGRYESHGLIIPTIASPFYLIFKNGNLTYRMPAAIISIAEILILFCVLFIFINKTVAFWASFFLITLPIHLFYSRTELVVILSSILTTLIITFFYFFSKKINIMRGVMLGIILGFSATFHTSVRTISMTMLLVAFLLITKKILQKRIPVKDIRIVFFIILFVFIGFGPRILFSPPNIFFQTRSLSVQADSKENLVEKIDDLKKSYLKSFAVYFYEPTASHFPVKKPILDLPQAFLLFFGAAAIIFAYNNAFFKTTLFLLFSIPFTNSAITEALNNDHRLAPMFPVVSVICAVGVYALTKKLPKYLSFIFFLFISIILLGNSFFFFYDHSAEGQSSSLDFSHMKAIYFMKQTQEKNHSANQWTISCDKNCYDYLNFIHVKEQEEYFLLDIKITKLLNPNTTENNLTLIDQFSKKEFSF